MGALFGYYAADDDEHAGRAVLREDGRSPGAGYDEVVVKGISPMIDLLPVEERLTGRSAEQVRADPRHCRVVGAGAGGEIVTLSLTDAFRDALARADGGPGAAAPERDTASGDLAHLLPALAALAERAVARGQRLYCWIRP
ncbi:hypothetical protein [Kitasatospora nipponensis]